MKNTSATLFVLMFAVTAAAIASANDVATTLKDELDAAVNAFMKQKIEVDAKLAALTDGAAAAQAAKANYEKAVGGRDEAFKQAVAAQKKLDAAPKDAASKADAEKKLNRLAVERARVDVACELWRQANQGADTKAAIDALGAALAELEKVKVELTKSKSVLENLKKLPDPPCATKTALHSSSPPAALAAHARQVAAPSAVSFLNQPRIHSHKGFGEHFNYPYDLVDAFVAQPEISPTPRANEARNFLQGFDGVGDREKREHRVLTDYRFDRPARFPLVEYGIAGSQFEAAGAVIYEGMRLKIREDGRYQLRFVLGTPDLPVTMRLQLHLQAADGLYTLTVPPISIPEKPRQVSSIQGLTIEPVKAGTQVVSHEGYLPRFALDPKVRVVSRSGTARFGFGVNVP